MFQVLQILPHRLVWRVDALEFLRSYLAYIFLMVYLLCKIVNTQEQRPSVIQMIPLQLYALVMIRLTAYRHTRSLHIYYLNLIYEIYIWTISWQNWRQVYDYKRSFHLWHNAYFGNKSTVNYTYIYSTNHYWTNVHQT